MTLDHLREIALIQISQAQRTNAMFTKGQTIYDRDTGYDYRVLNVTTRVVVIVTAAGNWVESISHAVAALKYR